MFTNYPEEEKAAAFAFIQHMMAGDENSVAWALAQQCSPDSKKVLADTRITEIPTIRSQAQTMDHRVCFGERPIEAEKLWRTMFDQAILEKRPQRMPCAMLRSRSIRCCRPRSASSPNAITSQGGNVIQGGRSRRKPAGMASSHRARSAVAAWVLQVEPDMYGDR